MVDMRLLCLGLAASGALADTDIEGFHRKLEDFRTTSAVRGSGTDLRELQTDLLALITQIRSMVPADPRLGDFAPSVMALNYVTSTQWPDLSHMVQAFVTVPTEQEVVPTVQCGILEDIMVPTSDEHWPDTTAQEIQGLQMLQMYPMAATADECGEWAADEIPEVAMAPHLMGLMPENRKMQAFGELYATREERYSDKALSDLFFRGSGQTRVSRVRFLDWNALTPNGLATYAVYLDFMRNYEVKPGFEPYGADGYFDAQGNVLAIRRGGSWSKPGDGDWEMAKAALRGSLAVAITSMEHLHECHLAVGNAIVTANVRDLPPDHPIRRLMTPFGFRTEAINYRAALSLTTERGLLARSFAFTNAGLAHAFADAREEANENLFLSIPRRFKRQRIDPRDMTLPLHEDGLEFYNIANTFVQNYVDLHFGKYKCHKDADLRKWWATISAIVPEVIPPIPTCRRLVETISTFIYIVTAQHTLVGRLGSEVSDPCYIPSAWKAGAKCGMPRTHFTLATTMATTAFDQVPLVSDFSYMFPDQPSKDLWHSFTDALVAQDAVLQQRNADRNVPFRTFETMFIESSVGI